MSLICSNHLFDLDKMVKAKNMGKLTTSNPDVAKTRAQAWLLGNCPMEQFDPLVVSVLEINQKGNQTFGDLGHKCPLCAANELIMHGAAHEWIDNCTDAMVVVARVNGLVG